MYAGAEGRLILAPVALVTPWRGRDKEAGKPSEKLHYIRIVQWAGMSLEYFDLEFR